MFKWLKSIIIKKVAIKTIDKIGLREGQVETKKWYTSKSLWTAIIAGALGIAQAFGQATGHPIVIPSWVYEILASVGLYSLRVADKPIQK